MKLKILLVFMMLSFVLTSCTQQTETIGEATIDVEALENAIQSFKSSLESEINSLESDVKNYASEIELIKSKITSIKEDEQNVIDEKNVVIEVEESEGIDEAEIAIIKFISGLKYNDLDILNELREIGSIGEAALINYSKYFDNDLPTYYIRYNNSKDSDDYRFKIYNRQGKCRDINIIWDKDNNRLYTDDNILNNSTSIELSVGEFINSMKEDDVERVSEIIYQNEEGEIFYEEAKATIDKYKENFDIESLEYEFTGEMKTSKSSYHESFIYRIYGSKDGKPVEHFIKVLRYWGTYFRDEWKPSL